MNKMITAVRQHWPEYLMEAAGLGIFMVSACLFTVLLQYPASPARQAIPNPLLRQVLGGIAMGLTAIGIVFSPWGKQSGAHINPAFTLTFFRLGKIERWDAFFYTIAQFTGGVAGVMLSAILLGQVIADPMVNYVITIPGDAGVTAAFIAEAVISFGVMLMVLFVTNDQRIARYTGVFVGALVALYISIESPFSGMSMNPARSFGSALPAHIWTAFWIYMIAPPLGMLAAAEVYLRIRGADKVICAKFHHHNNKRCIFRCGYRTMQENRPVLEEQSVEGK